MYLRPESRRFYPSGETTTHLVGVTNIDDQGIDGIEQSFNEHLRPEPQKHRVRKDALGRVIETLEITDEGKLAENLQLSIDQRIQSLAYQALKKASISAQATSASLVLLNARTGELLAIVIRLLTTLIIVKIIKVFGREIVQLPILMSLGLS